MITVRPRFECIKTISEKIKSKMELFLLLTHVNVS